MSLKKEFIQFTWNRLLLMSYTLLKQLADPSSLLLSEIHECTIYYQLTWTLNLKAVKKFLILVRDSNMY